MTDNRSERLRKRRKQSTARARNGTDEERSSERSRPSEQSDEAEADKADGSPREEVSVKEEQVGTYMYLPESQTKELRRQYNILKAEYEFEHDEEFEKNRHFYPLVVQHGLESLEEMDASEIRERLKRIM